MVYRTLVENFDRGRLNPFWVPVLYDLSNSYVKIENESNYATCFCNTANNDAAILRSMFPVCGQYVLWSRFRVNADFDDGDLFVMYQSTSVPVPDSLANLQDLMKIEVLWDDSGGQFEIYYYDTSNTKTGLDINNDASENAWYWIRIMRNSNNYSITIFNDDLTVLTGPSTIAISSVNELNNPDYITIGSLPNNAYKLDLDVDFISLKLNPYDNNYSNGIYYTNNNILGKCLG